MKPKSLDALMTLTVTMSRLEWMLFKRQLADKLDDRWPAWKIKGFIEEALASGDSQVTIEAYRV